jgi:hypothetical protein
VEIKICQISVTRNDLSTSVAPKDIKTQAYEILSIAHSYCVLFRELHNDLDLFC